MIRQCLSNAPASRPEVSEILRQIEDLKSSLPPSFENKVEMIQQIQSQAEGTDGQQFPNQRPPNDIADQSQLRQIVECLRDENEAQRNQIETLRRESEVHQSEMESKAREVEGLMKQLEAKTREVLSQNQEILSLREQLEKLSIPLPSPSTIEPSPCIAVHVDPDSPIKWRRGADLPVGMGQLRSVYFKGKVYVGGGYTRPDEASRPADFLVFQYDPRRDVWVMLPPCPVRLFTLSQFQGHLIAVGGCSHQNVASNRVYRYREESQEWEKYLKPMPTARFSVAIITTPSAIIACGGEIDFRRFTAAVEAYIAESGQWHMVDSLPSPYGDMKSVTIDGTCYLLGGHLSSNYWNKSAFQVQVSSLIESAFPPSRASAAASSTWKAIHDTRKFYSTAASMARRLLAVGGMGTFRDSAGVHVFVPADNAWVKMASGNLPKKMHSPAAIELPGMKLLVCGGWTNNEASKATFIGSFAE